MASIQVVLTDVEDHPGQVRFALAGDQGAATPAGNLARQLITHLMSISKVAPPGGQSVGDTSATGTPKVGNVDP